MGKDIHVRICRYDPDTNFYKEISLYRLREENEKYESVYNEEKEEWEKVENPDPYIKIPVFWERDSELFDGLCNRDDNFGCFPNWPISLNSLEPKLREEVQSYQNKEGYFDFFETTFADMLNYLREHPNIKDYDLADWTPECKKHNPIADFYKDCCNYSAMASPYGIWNSQPLSYYKVLYWFDW